MNADGSGNDDTILYKNVRRSDICGGILTNPNDPESWGSDNGANDIVTITDDEDPNLLQTIYIDGNSEIYWKPVSHNIEDIDFSLSNTGAEDKEDLLDVKILFTSQTNNTSAQYSLKFRKSIFAKNKLLDDGNFNCNSSCPNSKDLFSDYVVANQDDEDNYPWNPDTYTVPSARVTISDNYVSGEDDLEWDATVATSIGLTVSFNDDVGILSVSGSKTGSQYQRFMRTVRYVNRQDDKELRTTPNLPKGIVLTLGFPGICSDILGRRTGDIQHFYCYIRMDGSVNDSANLAGNTWSVGRNSGWPWWTQAQVRAESTNYYNLKGYLTTITSQPEMDFILEKIRISGTDNTPPVWIGGTDLDMEGEYKWASGPESVALGDLGDSTLYPNNIRSEWSESCFADNERKIVGDATSPNESGYCYPGYAGLGIGVFYRDDGGGDGTACWYPSRCNAAHPNYDIDPYETWALNHWGVNSSNQQSEPNDCCQDRDWYDYNIFNIADGEIIPDTFANRYIGRYNDTEANLLLDETKRNGIALSDLNSYNARKGNLYYNTNDQEFKAWNGSQWVTASDLQLTDENTPTRNYNTLNNNSYRSNEIPPNAMGAGEQFMQFRSDGRWNDLYLEGHRSGSLESKGFVAEWSGDWVVSSICSDDSEDSRYACVNYYNQFNVVLDDYTYLGDDMLDFCDTSPRPM